MMVLVLEEELGLVWKMRSGVKFRVRLGIWIFPWIISDFSLTVALVPVSDSSGSGHVRT